MISLELLAPARSADIGIAAIRCGADAVYIGGPAFGARAAAGNSVEDIERLCSYAKPFGVRIFVTVNTLARNEREREQAVALMRSLKGKGVAAFILQDTSLIELIAAEGDWQEEFHASTQCTLLTPERAVQLAGMGFSRLILERQLSIAQIHQIRAALAPQVQLEAFVHGALCMCYSGACFLSEHLSGRSANRGECSQPCRSRYDLLDSSGHLLVKDKPLLSLKDLCLIDRLEDLAREGICSFKIEGRLKNESYVKNVVRAYDQALWNLVEQHPDRYCRASRGRCSGGFTPDVNKTFNRGYTALYLDGTRGDWLSGEAAKAMGEQVGSVRSIRPGSIDITLEGRVLHAPDGGLHNGDGLCVTLRGGEVAGFRADRVEVLEGSAQRVYCKLPEGLREGAKVWRNLDASFERTLQNNMPQRLIAQDVTLEVTKSDAILKCSDGNCVSEALPLAVQPADNQDRMHQIIVNQISKTSGNYNFSLIGVECEGDLPFLTAAFLNSLRRRLAEKLDGIATCSGITCKMANSCLPQSSAPNGELMRSKYCIRYQLGMCPKHPSGNAPKAEEKLFLRNNGRTLALRFDCAKCEMVVLDAGSQTLSQHSKR